jgi:hypothetical protein
MGITQSTYTYLTGGGQSLDCLTNPHAMATLLKSNGHDVQTTHLRVTRKYNTKLAKKPGHRWRDSRRMVESDSALMIMTGNILIVDVDDKVENIYDHIDIPLDCWVEKTPSGGWHIYFQHDEDIAQYNTNIKNKLWGFKEVDILIKNGFAYAGGTSYALPEDGRLVHYVWDYERNPVKVRHPCKIPEILKSAILDSIRQKEIETIRDMKPYILGCDGDTTSCAGCKKLSYRHMESVCQTFSSMEIGREMIREWTKDFDDAEYITELLLRYEHNNEYAHPPALIAMKRASEHCKVLPKHLMFKSIINTLNTRAYRPPVGTAAMDHPPAATFIKLLETEGLEDLIPHFMEKIK